MGIFNRKKEDAQPATTASQASTKVAKKSTRPSPGLASGVILRPLVTEKAAHLASTGQYVFEVNPRANKIQVKNAIRALYGITPTSVNMQARAGKAVRRGRVSGRRKSWKKALVTLPKGKTIEVYEGV
ncbi:50S ribosomal protein L23 [Candidatus Uhrbacteria bacterium]|nr:50S ribosomal protein L23 [Candidatus Uhrbacteria bacterium]